MKKIMISLGCNLLDLVLYFLSAIAKPFKRINYQALLLSVMFFLVLAYAMSIVLTEIVSGIQIENIARNSGWGMFHLVLVGLSTLIARKVYKWLEHEK